MTSCLRHCLLVPPGAAQDLRFPAWSGRWQAPRLQ